MGSRILNLVGAHPEHTSRPIVLAKLVHPADIQRAGLHFTGPGVGVTPGLDRTGLMVFLDLAIATWSLRQWVPRILFVAGPPVLWVPPVGATARAENVSHRRARACVQNTWSLSIVHEVLSVFTYSSAVIARESTSIC